MTNMLFPAAVLLHRVGMQPQHVIVTQHALNSEPPNLRSSSRLCDCCCCSFCFPRCRYLRRTAKA
jgi:hypothetical protein